MATAGQASISSPRRRTGRVRLGSNTKWCIVVKAVVVTQRLTSAAIDRLAARIEQLAQPPKVGPGPIALLCRCQNVPALSPHFDPEATPTGRVGHVTLGALRLDLIMVQEKASFSLTTLSAPAGDHARRSMPIWSCVGLELVKD